MYFLDEYVIFRKEFEKTKCFSLKELESLRSTENIDANVWNQNDLF